MAAGRDDHEAAASCTGAAGSQTHGCIGLNADPSGRSPPARRSESKERGNTNLPTPAGEANIPLQVEDYWFHVRVRFLQSESTGTSFTF